MKEDITKLAEQEIYSACIVKKLIEGEYTESHFEFVFWVEGTPENFKAYPTKEQHKYNIYRNKEGKIIRKNISINSFNKSLSKLKKVEFNPHSLTLPSTNNPRSIFKNRTY